MSWWVQDYVEAGRYIDLVSWIFWVLLSITLHELAHGWAALWQGDRTPIWLNRMTANPIVHMGWPSLLVFALCGLAWGSMPVDPTRFRDGRRGNVYVSAAGPAMNVALAAACALLCILWVRVVPEGFRFFREGAVFFVTGAGLNLVLAMFNLLPIPPLDGSTILAGFSRRAAELFRNPQAQLLGTFLLLALFFASPLGRFVFAAGRTGALAMIDAGGRPVGNPAIVEVLHDREQFEALLEALNSEIRRGAPAPGGAEPD